MRKLFVGNSAKYRNKPNKFSNILYKGNGRGFDESRVKNLILNQDIFGDENCTKYLQSDEILGRLLVSNLIGNSMNYTGEFNELYMFSSRDFTVFEIFTDQNNKPKIFHYIFHQIMILNALLLNKCH